MFNFTSFLVFSLFVKGLSSSLSSLHLPSLSVDKHCKCNSSDTLTLELLLIDDEGDTEIKQHCGLFIPLNDLVDKPPGIKIEGKSNIKEPLMTLVAYSEHQRGVYIHWLISQVTGVHGRMGPMYSHLLSPGWEYIPYQQPSLKDHTSMVIALFKQKPEKHYYMQHRIRDKTFFFNGLGEIIACNQLHLL